MGFIFNFIKRLLRLSIYTTIISILIVVIPNIPPFTKFTSISLEPTLPREGSLAVNGDLNNAEKAYLDKLVGPECFQIYKGELYTSLSTGEIVKLSPGGHVTFVTTLGQPCGSLIYEHICGRPLGFEIDEKNHVMYVADAYLGIWKVDLKDDKKTLLVSPRVPIEGRTPKLFNSVALDKNGNLYWTDSSSDFPLKDGSLIALADPSGRLFHYNAATNKSTVLLDDMWFANGLAISPNNDFLLVAESSRYRVLKYYIAGPKKGKSEVFITGLPGIPDNIRVVPDQSGVTIGLYLTFDERSPLLPRSMAGAPLVRKLLARIHRLVEIPFEYLNTFFPHPVFDDILYNVGHLKTMSSFNPRQPALIYVDWDGKVISSHYNTDDSVQHISEAIAYNDRLYMANPHVQNFIASVPIPPALRKVYQSKSAQKPTETPKEVKKEAPKPVAQQKPVQKQAKPVEEKPKPTPKPTTPPPPKQETKPTPKPEVKPPPTPKPQATTTPPPKPKQEAKTTPPPATKPVTKPTPQEKSTTAKPEKPKRAEEKAKVNADKKPEQIPIREEIPSDTAKPSKETLKVIKKDGPAEIPNPNL